MASYNFTPSTQLIPPTEDDLVARAYQNVSEDIVDAMNPEEKKHVQYVAENIVSLAIEHTAQWVVA